MWYREARLWGIAPFILSLGVLGFTGFLECAAAQTIFVPTLSVSGEYDSNVFWTPKSLLSPGQKPEDFVTTLTPQLTMAHIGPQFRGNLSVGALVSRYINNPDLDYTGVNTAGSLDASQWAKKFSQRVTTLTLTGTYIYTPSMNAFGAASGQQFGGNFGATNCGMSGMSCALNSGLVTNRVSVNTINVGISGGYQLTRTSNLTGTYNYSTVIFGNQYGVENQLFNTTGHTGMLTLSTLLTPRDTVGTTATISHFIQDQSGGVGEGSFTTPTGTVNWTRRWTQQLSTNLSGGAMVLLPIDSTIPGQGTKTQVAPTTTIAINYTSFSEALRSAGTEVGGGAPTFGGTGSPIGPFSGLPNLTGSLGPGAILPPGLLNSSLTYNYSFYPSYAFGAGATKTHVIGANVFGGITAKLTGQVGLNYSHGSSVASTSNFTFDSAGVTAGARYLIGPVLASLTANWMYFSNSTEDPVGGSSDTAFSKKTIMLALSYAFTNRSYFSMDRFGYVGPRDLLGGSGGDTGPSGSSGGSAAPAAPAAGPKN